MTGKVGVGSEGFNIVIFSHSRWDDFTAILENRVLMEKHPQ